MKSTNFKYWTKKELFLWKNKEIGSKSVKVGRDDDNLKGEIGELETKIHELSIECD